MIKFIIIDDDVNVHKKIKQIINEVTFNLEEEIKISFHCKFDKDVEKDMNETDLRKIYLLDVDLKDGPSGIHIAEKIREVDWDSEIIFITNHDKMFETVHRSVYAVFDFIEKFHGFENKLKEDLNHIINKNFDNKMFKYSTRSNHLSLYYRSILYIYRDTADRRLRIVTDNNTYIVSLTLQEILKLLDDRFKFVHRACIANTNRIDEYNWNKGHFILNNGNHVDFLSKKFKKDIEK